MFRHAPCFMINAENELFFASRPHACSVIHNIYLQVPAVGLLAKFAIMPSSYACHELRCIPGQREFLVMAKLFAFTVAFSGNDAIDFAVDHFDNMETDTATN